MEISSDENQYHRLTAWQKAYCVVKWIADFLIALVGSLVLIPLFAAIWVAVKAEDGIKAPVLFTQKRVGKGKKYFMIYKFRTMKLDTPHDMPTHLLQDPDQYITKIGRFLRKTSLDELPQLWNILKGDLSLCGPRPALWNQEDLIAERDRYGANDVRPGLTGWAQIHGRDALEIEDKAALDGYYVKHLGPVIDIKCFFGTFVSVFRRDGVVEGGTGALKQQKEKEAAEADVKKILIVANSAAEHVNKFHLPIISMLKEQGYQVDVACKNDAEVPGCDHQFDLPCDRNPFRGGLRKSVKQLKGILSEGKYDLLSCNTITGSIIARLAATKALRRNGLKVLYMIHGLHFFQGASLTRWLMGWPMERALLNRADAVCTINQEDYNRIRQKMGYRGRTYLVHGVGVDTSRFREAAQLHSKEEYRAQYDIPQDAFVLIYVAEITKLKNQASLLRTVASLKERIPNLLLLLAGRDHLNGGMQRWAAELGIEEHVRFLGWRKDVPQLLCCADVAVSTSTSEGLGLNLIEAAAAGVPVVAYDNRGHREIIEDGKNGRLICLGDERGLAQAILELYQCSEKAKQMALQARADADRFELSHVLEQLKDIYRDLLCKK